MHRYQDIELDENGAPVNHAKITVLERDGITKATLYDDLGNSLSNPVFSDVYGVYYYNVVDADVYWQQHRYNGILQLVDIVLIDITYEAAFAGPEGPEGPPGPPGYKAFTTWALLNAAPGSTAHEVAFVYGPDAGTHTDPVVGGTVANVGVYAWSVSPAGWQRVADLSASAQTFLATYNGTTAQTQLLWSPPQSAINSEGGYDNVDLKLLTSIGYVANYGNGTFGTDYTFGLGWNCNSAFSPEKAGQPAVSYRIESKYRYNSATFGGYLTQCEIHVGALTPKDDPSVEFRPITIGAPHAKADWATGSTITFTSAYIPFLDGAVPPNEYLTIDARTTNRLATTTRLRFRENQNDYVISQQRNAVGNAYLNLPFVNASDHLKSELPLDIIANSSVGATGNNAVVSFGSSVTSGAALLSWTDFAVTGNNTVFDVRGSASTYLEHSQNNNHASGASGHSLQATGPQYYGFADTASGLFYGMRYVGGGTKTLSIGGQLRGASNGVGDFVTFNCVTGQTTFAYPDKAKNYTVAGLPSAATAGAYARAFVSDASAPAFGATVAGGGAVITPVYSDGTNWKVG